MDKKENSMLEVILAILIFTLCLAGWLNRRIIKMKEMEGIVLSGFINHTITAADKFIKKVETGTARSKETYKDLKEIKEEAELLKKQILAP